MMGRAKKVIILKTKFYYKCDDSNEGKERWSVEQLATENIKAQELPRFL